jgi:hypothetical protein
MLDRCPRNRVYWNLFQIIVVLFHVLYYLATIYELYVEWEGDFQWWIGYNLEGIDFDYFKVLYNETIYSMLLVGKPEDVDG